MILDAQTVSQNKKRQSKPNCGLTRYKQTKLFKFSSSKAHIRDYVLNNRKVKTYTYSNYSVPSRNVMPEEQGGSFRTHRSPHPGL